VDNLVPIKSRVPDESRPIFDLRDLVYVVFRRRAVILAIWLPILIVGALGLFRQMGSYVASSRVLLELQGSDNLNNIFSNPNRIDYDLATSTYIHLAMSVPVADMAAAALADSLPVLEEIDPKYRRLRRHDKMLEFLLDHVDVSRVAESNLLDIRFSSPHERVSLMVDKAILEAFITYAVDAGKNDEAMGYYRDQIAGLQADIDSLLAVRADIYRQTGFSSIEDDMREGSSMVRSMENELYRTQAEARFREANVAMLRKALATNPDFVPAGAAAAELAHLRGRIETLTEELNKALAAHPEGSRAVQEKRQVLAESRQQLRDAVEEYIQNAEIEAAAWRSKAEEIETQIAQVQDSLSEAPLVYQQVRLIDAQIAAKTKFLQEMHISSGEVGLRLTADARVNRLIKVTEPEIDQVISEGRKFAYFGVIGLFGLVLGILVGVVVDRGDHRVHNPDVLSQHTPVPVLGAITEDRGR